MLILLLLVSIPAKAEEVTYPSVDGVMGLESDDGGSWLAIGLTIAENHSLSDILWYNNDNQVIYPTVSIGTGHNDGPGSLTDMVVVAEQIGGSSSSWSSMTLNQPIGASLGRLYVVLTLPASWLVMSPSTRSSCL